MPRPKDPAKLALQKYTGLSRQAIDKRFKSGIGTTTFHDHLCRKMKATADLAEQKAASLKIEVARLKESVIAKEQVQHDCKLVTAIWCEEINRLRAKAPGKLVGLDEVGVRIVLDQLTDEMIEGILDGMDNIDPETRREKIRSAVRADRDSR